MGMKEAKFVLKKMEERGFKGSKIGKIRQDFPGEFPTRRKGDVVIYRDTGDGTVTLENPMTAEAIQEQEARGSGLLTVGTMVNVPRGYIK